MVQPTRSHLAPVLFAAVIAAEIAVAFHGVSHGAEPVSAIFRENTFDRDPGWDGYRNRLDPPTRMHVTQHFGHQSSRLAGGESEGEIGGTIHRSTLPATFSRPIPERTLQHRLRASGRFAVTRASSSSGVMFGWFNSSSRGWRTPNSLGFRIDGNGGKYWVFYEYGTKNWKTGGGGAFEGDRYQTTATLPFVADGTSHTWELEFIPCADGKPGELRFRIDDRTYAVDVPEEHCADGAVFDRFGIWNVQIPGENLDVYFDDVVRDGQAESFDAAEDWTGFGNDVEFDEPAIRPYHQFGFTDSAHAGSHPGEIGGYVFRDVIPTYYADRISELTLDDPLSASGLVVLNQAGSDSGVRFGWFDSQAMHIEREAADKQPETSYLAITLEGPSRFGHFFRPSYATSTGSGLAPLDDPETGKPRPLIRPNGTVHRWNIHYDPDAAEGRGVMTVGFDDREDRLVLAPGDRSSATRFDRFGVFNIRAGGHHVELYLDDLRYTANKAR